jgi:4-hydroxybenzoate polyprenyltransferase
MVTARNAAMAFNRYLDKDIDKENNRTSIREIPRGIIQPGQALVFVIINCSLFILFAACINLVCLYLSPIALLIILGYSYTKRFTWLCHFILGLGLALAPTGAYLAITGHFSANIILLSSAVFFWVSGFDIIYALQDVAFDKQKNLKSVPVLLGIKNARHLSLVVHIVCIIFLLLFVRQVTIENAEMGLILGIGTLLFIILVIYQHTIVNINNLSRIDSSFFLTNGIASLLFGLSFVLDIYV